jgi:hypothetical protein
MIDTLHPKITPNEILFCKDFLRLDEKRLARRRKGAKGVVVDNIPHTHRVTLNLFSFAGLRLRVCPSTGEGRICEEMDAETSTRREPA